MFLGLLVGVTLGQACWLGLHWARLVGLGYTGPGLLVGVTLGQAGNIIVKQTPNNGGLSPEHEWSMSSVTCLSCYGVFNVRICHTHIQSDLAV